MPRPSAQRRWLRGIAASSGIALGVVVRVDDDASRFERGNGAEAVDHTVEQQRLRTAVDAAVARVRELQSMVLEGSCYDSHELLESEIHLLSDPELLHGALELIARDGVRAEWAVQEMGHRLTRAFSDMEDPFLRSRQLDVDGAIRRLVRTLAGVRDWTQQTLPPNAIVVARNLSTSDLLSLATCRIGAVATDLGGQTSHVAILARALEIPAVVGIGDLLNRVADGDPIVLDGHSGHVICHPTRAELQEFEGRQARQTRLTASLSCYRERPAETPDGHTIRLRANLDLLGEAQALHRYGAEGVGLLRTEYLFLNRRTLPSEDEQTAHYTALAEQIAPQPLTIRTIDLGGDKMDESEQAPERLRGFARLRGLRHCLRDPELFLPQLRAILRASAHGNVRLLVPFVSCATELVAVRKLLREAEDALDADGLPWAPVPVGAMIEIPSAALAADHLARNVDFFSVGTNDLFQYTFATAREQNQTSYLYHPLHPAMLRMLALITKAARAACVPVGLCGEMAGEPAYASVLMGLGFEELSMPPSAIPLVKAAIRRTPMAEARAFLAHLMTLESVTEIEAVVEADMARRHPDLCQTHPMQPLVG